MSVVQTLIGNVKGPQGATGATGATGADGTAATIAVGSVTTTAYGNAAQVTNSGTSAAAVFDFVIPQGKPGEATTTMGDLTLDSITASTASFPTPTVGDTGKVVFGKINKFFADVVSALSAKLNTSNVVNNFTTTDSGYALDARAGKTLNDSLNGISFKAINLPSNSTKTLTIGNATKAVLYIIGANANACLEIIANTTSTGTLSYQALGTYTGITISSSNNTLTIQNTLAVSPTIEVVTFQGSVSG